MVDNSIYRYKNKIPAYQKVGHLKHYDRNNDGLYQGRSIDTFQQSRYSKNMTELLNNVNKPYTTIETNYKDYVGPDNDDLYYHDDLLFTGWNLPPEKIF